MWYKESNGNRTIFLSYNWHDKEIADRIDKHLSGLPDMTVKRDIRDIGPWKSIRKFMEGIRQQDYAVLIVSDSYLKSKNCMFEVIEIMKEQEYDNRMFFAVVEYGIYDPLVRAGYIKYWQQECVKLEAVMIELEPEYIAELILELKKYKSIASSMGKFLSIVADKNNPDITEIELQIEKAILEDYMEQDVRNNFENCSIGYILRNNIKNYYIPMFKDSEREFVITYNVNTKPVGYFTGRETELQDLRQMIEEGRKSVLVSGMGGIGKTHICRKLFEEYLNKHAGGENIPFCHIGYIEYSGNMGNSLKSCLKYKKQDEPEQNQEAAWRELEYLASSGKLLLFIDNVNMTIEEDAGLKRLKGIPGTVVLITRRTFFIKEFELYNINFLSTEQCKMIYKKIRYEDENKKVSDEETQDLLYIIEKIAAGHIITVEFLARLARTKHWTVKKLRDELQEKGFQLEYRDEEDELVNIQKAYETLYDLSKLTKAEQNILEAFSVFPYIPLEAETCNDWLLADAGVDEEEDIFIDLYRKGWLQFDMKNGSYSIHPVFAKFIYGMCKPKIERHHGLIKACKICLKVPKNDEDFKCQKYIPFVESIVEKIDMKEDIEQIQFVNHFAFLLEYMGEYNKAEILYKKNMFISEKKLGEGHPETGACYNNLARIYMNQKKYNLAEGLYKKSLWRIRKELGERYPEAVTCYNNLAEVYMKQGNNYMALIYYCRAYKICVSKLELKHPNTQIVYRNMQTAYYEQNPEGNFKRWLEEKMEKEKL